MDIIFFLIQFTIHLMSCSILIPANSNPTGLKQERQLFLWISYMKKNY